MESITSADGTEIAYKQTGEGPPVVLVHGSTGNHREWREIVPTLAEEYTVYAINRRGRGMSGDADDYAIEREYEDVAAVVDHVASVHETDPVSLVGHSYGAICALHALLETDAVDRLVIYEPPLGEVPPPEGAAAGLAQQLEEEGADATVAAFLQNSVGMTPEEVDQFRKDEMWDHRLEAISTVPRETRAIQRGLFKPDAFSDVTVPTALLVGGESLPPAKGAVQMVADALNDSRILTLEGGEHFAIHNVPTEFTETLMNALAIDTE
ncbi:alpha/beta fold hydrolase [Halostagnicola bangensis]